MQWKRGTELFIYFIGWPGPDNNDSCHDRFLSRSNLMRYEIKKSSTSLSLSLFFSNYFIRLDKSYSITRIKNDKKKNEDNQTERWIDIRKPFHLARFNWQFWITRRTHRNPRRSTIIENLSNTCMARHGHRPFRIEYSSHERQFTLR